MREHDLGFPAIPVRHVTGRDRQDEHGEHLGQPHHPERER